MADPRAIVIDFLQRCVDYSEASITRKKERGDEEDIPRWQAYMDFTCHAIKEIEAGELDAWFTAPVVIDQDRVEFDPSELKHLDRARLIDGLVGPRPVFVASTRNEQGIENLSVLSTIAPVSNTPALLSCSLSMNREGRFRDTLLNLRENAEMRLHLMTPSSSSIKSIEAAVQAIPSDESEWDLLGAQPPHLPGTVAVLDCTLVAEHELPEDAVATLCILRVDSIEIPESLLETLLQGGHAEVLHQHGWCLIKPSDGKWQHQVRVDVD